MRYLCTMEKIVNKVAESGLITLNLEDLLPDQNSIATFDLAPFLFKGMILREKDFREALPNHDWTVYENKQVAVFCTADAIIPMWAYMLIAVFMQKVHADVFFGTKEELIQNLLLKKVDHLNLSDYEDKRIVVKGCGDKEIFPGAYLSISAKLAPVVKSLMFGEPCSTVPIYKKK